MARPRVVEKRFRSPAAAGGEEDDRYMRLGELARYSSLSVSTLRRFIADPVHPLPVHRVLDRVVLVRKREFDRWVQEREAMAAAAAPEPPGGLTPEVRRIAMAVRGWPVDR
jgi:predicted DNA-binding transcriptional regulator AlpA